MNGEPSNTIVRDNLLQVPEKMKAFTGNASDIQFKTLSNPAGTELDENKIDAIIGEFAKKKATNKKKLYSDKVKALESKYHLNNIVSN